LAVDAWWAVLAYDDVARALLTRCKNGQRRDLVAWLADRAAVLPRPPADAVLTWAPTGSERRRRRGFDQAELLARALARRWVVPCRATLRRRPGPAQAGRRGLDRRIHAGFDAIGVLPRSVVVVDDVATTGATLTAAGRALRAGGAEEVRAVVVARAAAPGAAPIGR
jgi:predicted amidophosphoribosyltransferase